jgi:hypothetical protein
LLQTLSSIWSRCHCSFHSYLHHCFFNNFSFAAAFSDSADLYDAFAAAFSAAFSAHFQLQLMLNFLMHFLMRFLLHFLILLLHLVVAFGIDFLCNSWEGKGVDFFAVI